MNPYHSRHISHIIGVANPGHVFQKPAWFAGEPLQIFFADVVSEADASQYHTRAPGIGDIRQALDFFRVVWSAKDSRILVTCDYGASRSPALAYLFIADDLGPGRESEAFKLMLEIRDIAVPNGLVVRLGDTLLKRNGALLGPLKEHYKKIEADLFK
ncbi:MAG TPA: hypothetical protein VG733_17270 [Chthoniobacteraceae bacterium]|nr:hypothetical protein [Chthoniobacteraceae bacterium]